MYGILRLLMKARFLSEVTGLDGRRIQFRVEAWDDRDKIAEGTHERAIIDIGKFAERVTSKRAAV
jgi:fluoroacetyl-CoA thioesterase